MQNLEPEDTKPIPQEDLDEFSTEDSQPQIIEFKRDDPQTTTDSAAKPARKWLRGGIFTIVGIMLVLGSAALAGYRSGTIEKNENTAISEVVEAVIQFELGLKDLQAGQCEFARQRFESVLVYDPQFPGVAENLAQTYVCISSFGTPTPIPSATLIPTQDVRSAEELFAVAQTLLAAQDWDRLLETLDSLRKNNADYQPVKIDGLYFLALRNRGQQRILVEGQLESGIFDLTRAEQFGPLDVQGDAYRVWAGLYLSGLSFWEVDWGQSVFYFEQVVPFAPNLWDGSYLATDRLATAEVYYAGELIVLGDYFLSIKGWCDANNAFKKSRIYAPLPIDVEPTAEWADRKCANRPDAATLAPTPEP